MNIAAEIFRSYDIRGVVDKTLTNDTVYQIGCALGSKVLSLGSNSIVIGRDGRISGQRLSTQLANGIRSVGCNVVDIGLAPTPVLYFAAEYLNIKSAVMLTGSHNPADYNGLKIIIDGITIYGSAIQELYQIIMAQQFVNMPEVGNYTTVDVIDAYIQKIVSSLNITRKLKIVIDCGNGVPGIVAPKLLNNMGCTVIPLYCDVDGTFPNHHPDPSDPHNLQVLQQTVISQGADLGLAFDGDGDRLGVIDNNGKIIWPDRVLMLYAQQLLKNNPGATIIYDVKCSRDVEAIVKQSGGIPLMWNTGHSLIKAKMRTTGSLLAGEMSGHIFFKDSWYGFDDALYAAARLIKILSDTTDSAEKLFSEFPEQVCTPELSIQVTEQNKFTIMRDLINTVQFSEPHKIITIDGMRVEFADGWGLVRPSNTTPKLVVRFEAINAKALKNIQDQFRTALLNVDAALELPF